ncbi:alpha/beta fold hydrolase [Actinomadura parmotrematis]|uniref:Alpha/beta hydrolase n=1 Tax=Actinomadura parmotrematis TaxID=2864039 RepID=A0ABS7FZ89_9ACTN|nr:alpha/beta hydrolase [Actinomadura parmotrematis]MBW8485762.1 alpha/beta hydrolase [Actinomadura parmotrematis]
MFFQTHDGTRLAYEDHGQGEVVVLAASAMLSADMWEYQIPFLVRNGYRCVALDRRGHGRSDRPSGGYDLDTCADDLAALIEHLDLRDVTLAGHSMGGAETVRYLARHGADRVRRAALISATVPCLLRRDDNPQGLPPEAAEASLAALDDDRPGWLARQAQAFFATHLGNAVSPAMIEHTVRMCLATSPWAVRECQRSVLAADLRPDLATLALPLLVVHGAADMSAPVHLTGRRIAELVPHADYREYPTAGHGLYYSHRAELNAELLAFLKG